MINCDSAFRFFWLKSKFEENDLKVTNKENDLSLELIPCYELTDEFAVQTLFQTHPVFDDGTELDGVLYYHKECSYTAGETPLVLWLFAFMIEELFDNIQVHPHYKSQRPATYTNYLDYIKYFDENLRKRKKKRLSSTSESMEHEPVIDSIEDGEDEMQRMIELEMTGNDV